MMLALVPLAFPCGGFVAPPEGFAVSDTQEVIYTPGDGTVRVDYRVLYQGDSETFGWIVPIPGAFVSLEDGDDDDFTALRDATAPVEDFVEVEQGCAPRSKGADALSDSGAGGVRGRNGVDVVASGYTGTYSYDVLDATSGEALNNWLTTHGFDLGPNGTAIDAYVSEGKWLFVAIALEGEPEQGGWDSAGGVTYEVPPVSIVYEGSDLTYPARMGRGSTASTQHSILYVRGDQRAHVSGWGEDPIEELRDDGEDPSYLLYSAWPERLAEAGAQTKYGVVFAGELDGRWVTRFETLAAPAANTTDAVFTLSGGTETLHTVISNRGEDTCGGGRGAWVLLLPGLALGRRQRD